jgi:hypothetical protein
MNPLQDFVAATIAGNDIACGEQAHRRRPI